MHFSVAPGLKLSEIKLSDKQGRAWSAFDLPNGNGIIIHFFASWCPDCRRQMPEFDTASDVFIKNGVLCYAFTDEKLESITNYINKFNRGSISFFQLEHRFSHYGIQAIPTTYFIHANGSIAYSKVGALNWKDTDLLLQHFK
jgi:thiol-disulfide isomerase/thioredoxin